MKSYENVKMELESGLQTISYSGKTFKVVKAPTGYSLRIISAGNDITVKDITEIDSDALLVWAKVNGSYFDMSNTSENGRHYGVEQSETLDNAPKNSGYWAFAQKNNGDIVSVNSADYWYSKKDVKFGITPYSVRIHEGKIVNDRSTAYGDKDDTNTSQTCAFMLADGTWCLAVTATGVNCYPRDIANMAKEYGATECIIMDSGGSTQMFAEKTKVVYTGRKIANVLAICKPISSDSASGETTTGDTNKDAQIKALEAKNDELTAELKTATDKLAQIKRIC